jgi:hypothetical protein
MKTTPWLVLAGSLAFAAQADAKQREQAGYDVQKTALLAGVPVQIVSVNDQLRVEYTYGYVDVPTPTVTGGGLTPMQGAGVGLAGGLIASAIINAAIKNDAENLVEPAYATLKQAQCALPGADAYAQAVETAVRATPWGAAATLQRSTQAKPRLDAAFDGAAPRYVMAVTYSLTPDFAHVLTTVDAMAYAPALSDDDKRWNKDPAWVDRVVVASDRMELPPRGEAEIARDVEAENARYTAIANPLIERANKGDREAREEVGVQRKIHENNLKIARSDVPPPAFAASARAEQWTAGGCERLRGALQANAQELTAVLGKLFAGELAGLPSQTVPPPKTSRWVVPMPTTNFLAGETPATERRLFAQDGRQTVSRRAGDDVVLAYRYTWYEE